MSTFALSLVKSVEKRWAEVDRLLEAAKVVETSDPKLHDAICRSVVVLTTAHFEGFIRDVAKAVSDDVNRFSTFASLPIMSKRAFCKTFIPEDGKDANERTERLIAVLEGLDTKVNPECFMASNENEGHKNPAPSVIDRVSRNFGVRKIFSLFASSKLDDVFSCTPSELKAIQVSLAAHLEKETSLFPYTVDASAFDLHEPADQSVVGRTLWESFVDDLLQRRHRIAHGTNLENSDAVEELEAARMKVAILQYGFLLLVCSAVALDAANHTVTS